MKHKKHMRMNGDFIESHWIPQAMIMLSLEETCELECPAQSGLVHKTSGDYSQIASNKWTGPANTAPRSQPGSRSFCRRESLFVLLTNLLSTAITSQSRFLCV